MGFRFSDFNIQKSILGFDSTMQDVDFLYDQAYKIATLESSLARALEKQPSDHNIHHDDKIEEYSVDGIIIDMINNFDRIWIFCWIFIEILLNFHWIFV